MNNIEKILAEAPTVQVIQKNHHDDAQQTARHNRQCDHAGKRRF